MHELSLAQNLISQVLSLVQEHQAKRVVRVTVEIGPFSGVVVDSFRFGYEVLSQEHDSSKGSILEIREPERSFKCFSCGNIFTDKRMGDPCPECGDGTLVAWGGDDIILLSVEME